MKKVLVLIAALAATISTQADSFDYLTLERSDGSTVTLTAVGLEIKFNGTELVATNATTSESATITLSELASMYFSNNKQNTDAINTVEDTAQVWSISDVEEMFDLSGRRIDASARKTALRPGIYVVRKSNETKKIQVK